MPRRTDGLYKPKIDINGPLPPIAIIPEVLPGEYFALLQPEVIDQDLLPYYMISNYGRIWHKFANHFMSTSWDGPGYRIAVLALKTGKSRTFRVHRLLMLTFRYYTGCENMMINHKDGVKTHNYIDFPGQQDPDNLEWCDGSYNEKEAFRLGLKHAKYGEDHPLSTITSEQVRQICSLLQDRHFGKNILTDKQIRESVGGVSEDQIRSIKQRKCWQKDSKDYIF